MLIPLNDDKFAIIDDEDYHLVSSYKWYAVKGYGGKFYAYGTRGGRLNRENAYMARLIMKANKGEYVDHVNPSETLDNRKSNLRVCTNAQNGCNRGINRNSKLKVKGVCIKKGKKNKKYLAQIGFNGKTLFIGYFYTVEEASNAYNEKALELHKEYANFSGVKRKS